MLLHFQVLSQACGVVLKGELQDPKIAAWLLDPEAKEKSFLQMVEHFLPPESNLLQGVKKRGVATYIYEQAL